MVLLHRLARTNLCREAKVRHARNLAGACKAMKATTARYSIGESLINSHNLDLRLQ